MNIIIGSDHAGFRRKEAVKKHLDKKGIAYKDIGTYSESSVDYPDYAAKVSRAVAKDKKGNSRGLLICGSGTGMVIAANRIKGARAVAAYDNYTAKMSRADNDSNILCLRGRAFSLEKTKSIINTWLKTSFSGKQRHKRRLSKLDKIK